jgi:glycosidase
MKKFIILTHILIVSNFWIGCQNSTKTNESLKPLVDKNKNYVEISHPEWSKSATIYEVNIRQYTPEGTFEAFEKHLPRLKKMGIDIIWLMPIHPIGEKNRKGSLGSYYSVKDFYGINPEFGNLDQFKQLVDEIHKQGMYVIIDWVGNHCAWDNQLVTEHPEWFTKTEEGNFQPTPWYDWEDIIDFDYEQEGIRTYMINAMKYWVSETNIDGYRCDVAGFMPVDFWVDVRAELDQIKPVFMLAEWESRDLHQKSFDMTYSWSLWNKLHEVCAKKAPLTGLLEYLSHDVNAFPTNAYRMTFTDNHDKNSWEGNMYDNFQDGLETSIVFSAVVRGMPLVYSGQEAGLNRSLAFFEKDLIEWQEHPFALLYQKLFELKHRNESLWNGDHGGKMVRIVNDKTNEIIAFSRTKKNSQVIGVFNFSDKKMKAKLELNHYEGTFLNVFNNKSFHISDLSELEIEPWGYLVFEKR